MEEKNADLLKAVAAQAQARIASFNAQNVANTVSFLTLQSHICSDQGDRSHIYATPTTHVLLRLNLSVMSHPLGVCCAITWIPASAASSMSLSLDMRISFVTGLKDWSSSIRPSYHWRQLQLSCRVKPVVFTLVLIESKATTFAYKKNIPAPNTVRKCKEQWQLKIIANGLSLTAFLAFYLISFL